MAKLTISGAAAERRRTELLKQWFPDEDVRTLWTGKDEKGFFSAPRSLPLVLRLINKLSDSSTDPTTVYLDLLARHMGNGIVELGAEEEHAYAAGYGGNRAARTWRDRMKVLEKFGFIKIQARGPRPYGYAILVHPSLAVKRLRDKGKVPDEWWNMYLSRQMEVGETKGEEIEGRLRESNG